jgi:serine/threonine protein kinase
MEAERWQQIEELFHAALNRDGDQRDLLLAKIRADDEALYLEVQSLLACKEQAESFFEESASALAAEMFGNWVGETIGPYQVLSVLGGGGMGEVYLAQDARLGRRIALKLLPPQFTNDKDRLRRFQQEARAASALNHPNILTVYEVEQSADLHYIATEFIEGVTLRKQMAEHPLNLGDALKVAIQVAEALDAAHAAGIVHRDIKPENVMIRSDGYVKVLDFGLAKLTEHPATATAEQDLVETALNTDPGVVMGTPRYMSPEQTRGLAVDARTDIFSLGVMIFEMVTGKVPFDGATPSDVIASLLKDEPESLALSAPEAPVELERLVKKALAKNRDERYQTAAELLADLQQLKEEVQLDAKLGRANSTPLRRKNLEEVATLASSASESTNPQTLLETVAITSSKRWRWPIVLGVSVPLLVLAMVSVVFITRNKGEAKRGGPVLRPLTFKSGFITAARFAPDGKTVNYSAAFDGNPVQLFSTDLAGSETHSLGTQPAGLKSVSATTGEMAVLLDSEINWADTRRGTLAVVPLQGGQPRVLMAGIDEADWSPDGKTLAIARAEFGQQQLEYPPGTVLYNSDGWMAYPRMSPQGDKIAFLEHPLGSDTGSVLVLDIKSKNRSLVSSGWKSVKGLAWSPAGDEVWFAGSRESKKQELYAIKVSGELRLVRKFDDSFLIYDISREGRVLGSHGNGRSSIVILADDDPKMAGNVTPGRGIGLGATFAWSTSSDLSADGKTLLFYEWGHSEDAASVYLLKLDGSKPIRLGEGKALALSPDSKWALAVQLKSAPQLVLLPTGGGEPRTLPNHGIKEYHYASWFPDGRQILFTALGAEDGAELRSYVQNIESGEMSPITEEGTVALKVSPDGRAVFALDPDGKYYIHALAGNAARRIPGLKADDEPIQWSADGHAVYVRGPGDFATKVYRVEIANGRRRLVKEISPDKVGLVGLEVQPGGLVITPDGRSCVYTYWTLIQELMLVDGLK